MHPRCSLNMRAHLASTVLNVPEIDEVLKFYSEAMQLPAEKMSNDQLQMTDKYSLQLKQWKPSSGDSKFVFGQVIYSVHFISRCSIVTRMILFVGILRIRPSSNKCERTHRETIFKVRISYKKTL